MSLYTFLSMVKRTLNGEVSTNRLIKRGMRVGKDFHRGSGCFIDPTHCFLITIGNNVTMSINVTLLAHDASVEKLIGYTKIGQVVIEDNVFIGAGSIILPNITIGKNSVIGAGSVVAKDVPPNVVVAGNPAKIITEIGNYRDKHIVKMSQSFKFEEEYSMRHSISVDMIDEMKNATQDRIAYIK